jgi:hypothetical protein
MSTIEQALEAVLQKIKSGGMNISVVMTHKNKIKPNSKKLKIRQKHGKKTTWYRTV